MAEIVLLPFLWLAGALSHALPRLTFGAVDRLFRRLPDEPGVGPTAVFRKGAPGA